MYFIVKGKVTVILESGDIIAVLKKGDIFGEMALLNPTPSVRTASVLAKTDVVLAILSL